jgi:AcrR family transcriptional regulator
MSAEGVETDRRAQILDAAFEEFATQGFRGATIKGIAQRAHLQSQALIYWYFPTKEDLFQAVLTKHLPILHIALDPGPLLDRPPDEVLPTVARAYLATAARPEAQRLVRLVVTEIARRPEMADTIGGGIIARARAFLRTYFTRQIELGRLRPHNVRASARAFIGMLIPPVAGKVVVPTIEAEGPPEDEYIETVIAIFLHGLQPKT